MEAYMTANAVATGTYSDLRIVKGRKVAIVCIEIPLEMSAQFVAMFGMPNPAEETWVAIARLAADPSAAVTAQPARAHDGALASASETVPEYRRKAMQQAGILPGQLAFQRFIMGYPPGRTDCPVDGWSPAERKLHAEEALRQRLGIKSRRELAGSDDLCGEFHRLVTDFEIACGRRAA
jgi:hypothetical protein